MKGDIIMKNIILGVCGGIAAYKALYVTSGLKKLGYNIDVIMTKNAKMFVTELSFEAISDNKVNTDMFVKSEFSNGIDHIELAKKADLILVLPATANIIGKVANGIADDMLTTTIIATKSKVIFAPAMNTNMYSNVIFKKNMEYLKTVGYDFITPDYGNLACGDTGYGKLANTDYIIDYIDGILNSNDDLKGVNVLVTAGSTKSAIDPVRYFSNYSSGKMGYAIAKEARDRGANVTLISGETNLPPILGITTISVKTNEQMKTEVYKLFDKSNIVLMVAAVLDYKVKCYSKNKIKKDEDNLTITLEKDTDILKTLGDKKQNQILIGFAAETENVIHNAKAKLIAKKLDFIVANDISLIDSGFNSDFNAITIIDKEDKCTVFDKSDKSTLAGKIFDTILLGM
jgi:phosphopantothenoylcysteine decarboxylase / phosphopantothenate---cysteine ligase